MCVLAPHVSIIINNSKNLCTSRTLFGISIAFVKSTVEYRGLTPFLITHNLRYLFYVCPKNDFSVFTFNPASASFYRTFSSSFRWSAKQSLVIMSTFSMFACTISNPSKIPDIFSWNILWILHTPIGIF